MPTENDPQNSPQRPGFAARFTRWPDRKSSPYAPYRPLLRILAIPIIAVAGVFIYQGVRDRLMLPDCDSANAKASLANVFKQFQLAPTQYEPLIAVSRTNDRVVCNALLPLPDGRNVAVDYSFYRQGGTVQMRYSVGLRGANGAATTPLQQPSPPPEPPAPPQR